MMGDESEQEGDLKKDCRKRDGITKEKSSGEYHWKKKVMIRYTVKKYFQDLLS